MSAKPEPKSNKETVYIDVDDEITAIIDKVENAGSKVVALVLPKRAASLQSIVNMRLLKRSADNAGKDIVLVTTEEALKPLAGAAGIHVAASLQSQPSVPSGPKAPSTPASIKQVPVEEIAETDEADFENLPKKIDYQKSIGELAEKHDLDHPETIEIGDEDEVKAAASTTEKVKKTSIDKRLKVPNFDRFRLWLALGIIGLIALITFVILAIWVLPKASIAIQTTSTPVSASLTLTTSDKATSLDETKGIIPAVLKSSDQTTNQTVNATGQQNTGNKAGGTMVFYNCNQNDTLSGTTRTVAAGTGVTANGLTYITQQSATVPPSHFVGGVCQNDQASNTVNVIAQNGGAKYNQDAATYSVAGYATITGNGSKMTGGTDNMQTVLSQGDVDGASQKITSASSDAFTKNFENSLGQQGYYVITSTLKVGDPQITSTPSVGQPASTASVTVKITYTVLCVKKDDLTKAIKDAVAGQIDKTKQQVQDNDVLAGATVSVSNQSSPTVATLAIGENTSAVPIINIASVKKQAEGQKSGDIVASISNIPGVVKVDVKMSPFWVSKAPKNPAKITITTQRVSSSNGQ